MAIEANSTETNTEKSPNISVSSAMYVSLLESVASNGLRSEETTKLENVTRLKMCGMYRKYVTSKFQYFLKMTKDLKD